MTKAFRQAGLEIAALHAQYGVALTDLAVIAWANARGGNRAGEPNSMHAANPDARMTEYFEGDEYACLHPTDSRVHQMWA
jgi:hypothetical protein